MWELREARVARRGLRQRRGLAGRGRGSVLGPDGWHPPGRGQSDGGSIRWPTISHAANAVITSRPRVTAATARRRVRRRDRWNSASSSMRRRWSTAAQRRKVALACRWGYVVERPSRRGRRRDARAPRAGPSHGPFNSQPDPRYDRGMAVIRRGVRLAGLAAIGVFTAAFLLATTLYLAMWLFFLLISLDGGGGSTAGD